MPTTIPTVDTISAPAISSAVAMRIEPLFVVFISSHSLTAGRATTKPALITGARVDRLRGAGWWIRLFVLEPFGYKTTLDVAGCRHVTSKWAIRGDYISCAAQSRRSGQLPGLRRRPVTWRCLSDGRGSGQTVPFNSVAAARLGTPILSRTRAT